MSRWIKFERNWVIIALACGWWGCGTGKPNSTIVPPRPVVDRAVDEWEVDPEIHRLFGPSSPIGSVPRQPRWSPDSERVAYLRAAETTDRLGHAPRMELWLFDVGSGAERPLFSSDASVDEYTWVGSKTVVVAAGGDLHQVSLTGKRKQLTQTDIEEHHIAGAPDGSKVAFIRDHDVYYLDLLTGGEQMLTRGGHSNLTHGEVTWLYEEEFKTERGYGWSSDSTRLWFFETRLDEVESRIVPQGEGEIQLMPYPRPGEKNPAVRVGVLDVSSKLPSPVWLTPGKPSDVYIPRVMWHPDGTSLLVFRLDRLQTQLEILRCPVTQGTCKLLITESDPRYINLLPRPLFTRDGNALLRLSEKSGFAHIYRVDLATGAETQLTEGKWVVTRINAVDDAAETVFFTANAEARNAYKLYRAGLVGRHGDLEALSSERGCHDAVFAPDGNHFLDTHSALDRPPRTEVKGRNGDVVGVLAKTDLGTYRAPDVQSQLFPIETEDGRTLDALLTRPTAVRQDQRYPVLVMVYGGPYGQLAKDAFSTTFQPWRDLLASRGILVFSVDGRGSFGRGRAFENAIRLELGKAELQDQLASIRYLSTLPFVDPDRIGIFGWSYGGTMALNALLRTQHIFKLGVAVAPVADWALYDSVYTERYMQRPSDNPEGYAATRLTDLASQLRAPLLLVHGIADDNVHFVHSERLFDAFVKAGKHVDTVFYPHQGHKLKGPLIRPHLFSTVTRFIEARL